MCGSEEDMEQDRAGVNIQLQIDAQDMHLSCQPLDKGGVRKMKEMQFKVRSPSGY